jgi:carbonic anhydrase
VFDNMPKKAGLKFEIKELDPAALLPADPTYFSYTGSLTTPPCTEDVKWHVMRQPIEISYAQLAAFKKLYKMNARPVQPLNGRRVQMLQQ